MEHAVEATEQLLEYRQDKNYKPLGFPASLRLISRSVRASSGSGFRTGLRVHSWWHTAVCPGSVQLTKHASKQRLPAMCGFPLATAVG